MEIQTKQEILQYINRSVENVDEQAETKAAKEKLNSILSAESADAEAVETIKSFIASGSVNCRKLYAFCLNFSDSASHPQTIKQGHEEIVLNTFLREDEVAKLKKFVERHRNDLSFCEEVFKIMEKHGMTSSQVYSGVFMSRQDFSRVTNPNCKSVTRKMAWWIIIGLHCSLEEADEVLFSAGYVRRKSKLDLTMQFFIERGNYDIEAIDDALEILGLKMFTC